MRQQYIQVCQMYKYVYLTLVLVVNLTQNDIIYVRTLLEQLSNIIEMSNIPTTLQKKTDKMYQFAENEQSFMFFFSL